VSLCKYFRGVQRDWKVLVIEFSSDSNFENGSRIFIILSPQVLSLSSDEFCGIPIIPWTAGKNR
jgi:hypothetical protein